MHWDEIVHTYWPLIKLTGLIFAVGVILVIA